MHQHPQEKDLRLQLYYGDIVDAGNLTWLIRRPEVDEIYNVVTQRHAADHVWNVFIVLKRV